MTNQIKPQYVIYHHWENDFMHNTSTGYYAGSFYMTECYMKIKYATTLSSNHIEYAIKYKTLKLAQKGLNQLLKNPACNLTDDINNFKIEMII